MKHVSHLLDEYLDRLRNKDCRSDECRAEEMLYPPRERVEIQPRETWDPFANKYDEFENDDPREAEGYSEELPTREEA